MEQATLIPAERSEATALATVAPNPLTILSLAVERGAPIETIERMVALVNAQEERGAKLAFAADFALMKPKLPRVIRTKQNTQTASMYAPLEDINAAVDPILKEHGFSTATKIIAQTEKDVTVRAELWHRDGHVEKTHITMPLDMTGIKGTVNKTGPHALASSVTYGKRVALCALLNISTGDDADGNGSRLTDLQEHLDYIKSANAKELMRLFFAAKEAAVKAHDSDALEQINIAKENRKKELGMS